MSHSTATTDSPDRAYDAAHAASDLDIVPADWNVLPRSASRDEVDVHWFFNWAEGDMTPRPLLNPWERASIGKRVRTSDPRLPVELPGVQRAAARSSRVRAILVSLTSVEVSVLARWAAPPIRYPAAVRGQFGRLSAVAALTEGFEEIGATEAFVRACDRASAARSAEPQENYLRHAAKLKLAVIREQAEHLLEGAFAAYAAARARIDADAGRAAAHRQIARAPALAALVANTESMNDGGRALAALVAEGG